MAKKTALVIAFVIITGALLVSGRFFVSPSPSPSADPRVAAVGTISQENDNDLAPDFSLTLLNGNTITLSEYRGQKPVILDFFTTWCPNCRRDMPRLNRWYGKYKDQVEVIGINLQVRGGDFFSHRSRSFGSSITKLRHPLYQHAHSYR